MQVAEILSDLTSLRVCGHEEALALVNVHKTTSSSDESTAKLEPSMSNDPADPALRRAKDLVGLHYSVKVKYVEQGLEKGLQQGRRDVNDVLRRLGGSR